MPIEVGTNVLDSRPYRVSWSYVADGAGTARVKLGTLCRTFVSLSAYQRDGVDAYAVKLLDEYGIDYLGGLGAVMAAPGRNHVQLAAVYGTRELTLTVYGKLWLEVTGATAGVSGTVDVVLADPTDLRAVL